MWRGVFLCHIEDAIGNSRTTATGALSGDDKKARTKVVEVSRCGRGNRYCQFLIADQRPQSERLQRDGAVSRAWQRSRRAITQFDLRRPSGFELQIQIQHVVGIKRQVKV